MTFTMPNLKAIMRGFYLTSINTWARLIFPLILVILKVNKNFDSTGKSDEAINATFDFAVETLQGMAQTETALDLVENSVKEAVKEESVIVTDFTKYRNYGGKN